MSTIAEYIGYDILDKIINIECMGFKFACRLLKSVDEVKRRAAKASKEKHAAEVAAAELKGKSEAERDGLKVEVREICFASLFLALNF